MRHPSFWCVAALAAFGFGCNLSLPPSPESRVTLPSPCEEGQVPVSGSSWACADPGTLHTGVKADTADRASYAATADYAAEVNQADVADVALGFSPDATVTLGTAAEPIPQTAPAALVVNGAAYVEGAPVRFAVGSFDVHGIVTTPLGTSSTLGVDTFTLPMRPASNNRPADEYALQVRLTGSVSGAGNPALGEYSLCQVFVTLSLSGGGSFAQVATAEAGAFGDTLPTPPVFSLYGEGNLPHVPAGTYSVDLTLNTVDGVGASPQCWVGPFASGLRIAIDGT